ncbi:MAG TPA: twin-arginine translocase subunit TatC [Armatimonadota bacterium]
MSETTIKRKRKKRVPAHEREMGVMEHLGELRARIFRALCIVLVASTFVWFYFDPLYTFFSAPIKPYLGAGDKLIVTNWLEPFFLRLKLSLYGGLTASAPFWVIELWGFVAPALTPQERKPLRFYVPLSIVLFALGAALAHWTLPMAYRWALGYRMPGTELMQHANDYIELVAKLYLAFGLCFELPIILVFLAKVGITDAPMMRLYWRQAVLIIMTVAAVVTPSNDPLTMMMCAIPMAFLYLFSIILVERTT